MIIVGGATAAALIQYTDICRLQAVTLNGQKVQRVEELGLRSNRPILAQPVDSLADALMTRSGITRVDIDYKLPNRIRITTNTLSPVCYLLDSKTGGIYGLEESGRVVPVKPDEIDWDAPLFTGVAVKRIHDFPPDGRVMQMLTQMKMLRQTDERLHAQIEEIDLSRTDYTTVVLANKSYRLKLRSEQFAEKYREFDLFMGSFRPETDSVTSFDLTYNDMIIRTGYVEPKEKPVIDTSEVNDKAQFLDEQEMLRLSIAAEMQARKQQLAQASVKPATKPPAKKPTAANKSLKNTGGKKTAPGATRSKSTNKSKVSTSPTKKKTTSSKPQGKTAKHG
jgi:cell division septal protein FtsQ